MSYLETIVVCREGELAGLRARTRELCAQFGVVPVHSVRFATAVSEVVRSCLESSPRIEASFVLDSRSPTLYCHIDSGSRELPAWHSELDGGVPAIARIQALVDTWAVRDTGDKRYLVLGRKLDPNHARYRRWHSQNSNRQETSESGSGELARRPDMQSVSAELVRSKRRTARLQASARTMELALELAEIGIIEIDSQRDSCHCNELAAELLGVSEGNYSIAKMREVTSEINSLLLKNFFDLAWSGTMSEVIEWEDGQQWISAKIETREEVDGLDRMLVMMDVSERVARELELDERVQQEQELVGIVSHDLKSPLSTVSLTLEMLEEVAGPEQDRPIQLGKRAVQTAERMIQDLLDYTRDRLSGTMPITAAPCSLQGIVRPIVDSMNLRKTGRKLQVEVNGDVEGRWDAERLGQLVTNLVENALTYSPKDSTITVALDGRDETTVTLRVHNHGPAIRKDFQSKIFRPFARESSANKSDSLGLGMYIVRLIAEAHGGWVSMKSSTEEGTTFYVNLPRE